MVLEGGRSLPEFENNVGGGNESGSGEGPGVMLPAG
jgi:hypothetical protein